MALDEATAALLEQMRRPAGQAAARDDARGGPRLDRRAARADAAAGPEMAEVRDTRVRVSGGRVPVRILTPARAPRGVIVYYHGGGWVLGGLDDSDPLGRRLAQRTGCVVVLVDYRLAPEYRFPTAVDDSWAALRWAADAPGRAGRAAGAADRGGRQRGRQPGRGHDPAGPGGGRPGDRGCRCWPTRSPTATSDDLLPRPGQPAAC